MSVVRRKCGGIVNPKVHLPLKAKSAGTYSLFPSTTLKAKSLVFMGFGGAFGEGIYIITFSSILI